MGVPQCSASESFVVRQTQSRCAQFQVMGSENVGAPHRPLCSPENHSPLRSLPTGTHTGLRGDHVLQQDAQEMGFQRTAGAPLERGGKQGVWDRAAVAFALRGSGVLVPALQLHGLLTIVILLRPGFNRVSVPPYMLEGCNGVFSAVSYGGEGRRLGASKPTLSSPAQRPV